MKIGGQPFEAIVFDPEQVIESPWMRSCMGHVVAVSFDGSPFGDEDLTLMAGLDVPAAMRLPGRPALDYGGLDLDNQRTDAIARVIALDGTTGRATANPWAGSTGGIAQLIDGRFISWFSFVDVTGSGFHPDAYGGDEVVYVSATFRGAWMALSEAERAQLVYATSPEEAAPTDVLHDRFLELGGGDLAEVDDVLYRLVDQLLATSKDLDTITYLDRITYRRHALIALAHEMGVFDGCEEPRIDGLLRQWNALHAQLRIETALKTDETEPAPV